VFLLAGKSPTGHCVLIETAYAAGIRVSGIVGITWADVLPHDERVQHAPLIAEDLESDNLMTAIRLRPTILLSPIA
jgi:hypothetical protein